MSNYVTMLTQIEQEYIINDLPENSNTKAFAEACYDTNSFNELCEALDPKNTDSPDETDMQVWSLTEKEWYQAIIAAINERLLESTL